MREYTNSKTGNVVKREAPQDTAVYYSGKTLILETDKDGYVTYANKRFVETSGYNKDELIGLPHCMHMHPGMPEIIFKDACEMTSSGKTWNGYMKNIAKDGTAYWTETFIQPKFCEGKNIIGFMTIKREPDASALEEVIAEYEKLREDDQGEEKSQYCGEVYMGRGSCNL